jgi:fused signal recognition particle receptor
MKKGFGARIKALFGIKTFDEAFFEDLEDMLIEGDLGAKTAMEVSDAVRKLAKSEKKTSQEDLQMLMKELLSQKISSWVPELCDDQTNIFLILGVNGVGKTTTIAKLAHYYQKQKKSVVMAAADTFRAAAIDQLDLHAQRTGCRIIKQAHGSDPGAVLYDALQSAHAKKDDLVLADTAGRMHNKENLLRELQKIDKVIRSKIENQSCYKRFLVIDATTGQNGLSQAQLFHQAIGLDALILTKYDSAAKGGALIQIGEKLGIPIAFVGVGEQYDDLRTFEVDQFLDALVGINS